MTHPNEEAMKSGEKVKDLAEALRDTLNMLKAAHIQLGMQHDTNKRVIKARTALSQAEVK